MLKKYLIKYKKQFKHRKVYPNYMWTKYIQTSQYFSWSKPVVFYRGYVRRAYWVKLFFYVRFFRLLKKLFLKRFICFFSALNVNRMLTKKYKNSRMGKGVGKRYKWMFFLLPYYPIFIVYNCNKARLLWISRFLWNHSKISLCWTKTIVKF